MQRLTTTEEEIMQHIWSLEKCTVSDILDQYGDNRPPHSTISSVVRILEKKGFVDHKAYGRTHEYFPIIPQERYSRKFLDSVVGSFFQGSTSNLVSFLLKEKKIDKKDLQNILKELESDEQ